MARLIREQISRERVSPTATPVLGLGKPLRGIKAVEVHCRFCCGEEEEEAGSQGGPKFSP